MINLSELHLPTQRRWYFGLALIFGIAGYWAGNHRVTVESVDHVSTVLGDKIYHCEVQDKAALSHPSPSHPSSAK